MKDLINPIKDEFCLTDDQVEKLLKYGELIKEENKKYNLTAITDDEGIVEKHFRDSLFGLKYIEKENLVADIGSGAGLPVIPLAVVKSGAKFYAIESTGKKCRFLDLVSQNIDLRNLNILNSRIEDVARKEFREKFDVVTARAVAPLNTLLEYVAPLLKIGGVAVLYKGRNYLEELDSAKGVESILGLKLKEIADYDLKNNEKRSIIVYEKISKTDGRFPRSGNKPRLDPMTGGKNG